MNPNPPTPEIEKIRQAIAALESQRAMLGETVVETALAPLRQKLASLQNEASGEPGVEQRKIITVLFADVFGYTALSEKMDAEDVTNLMNELWLNMDSAIIAYGGEIDKHMGDGVMALWGVSQSREDDPERAVRAALAMQAFIRQWAQEKGHPHIAMRIGLHTGPALLGEIGTTGEFSAIGDTVNTASRLEQAAPPGGILISQSVFRQVRGIFELAALPPLTVKGKSEPLQVYRVDGARPRAFRAGTRGVEGVETRMIGRQAELTHLQETLKMTQRESSAEMVTITGEAGLGKSRLLHEFLLWVETHAQVELLKARADEEMQRIPYGLMRELFATRFEIYESDPRPVVREKLARGFGETGWGESAPDSAMVAQLVGYESADNAGTSLEAREFRNKALAAMVRYFRSVTEKRPLLILLDDLHWADDSSLDVILHLVAALADQPAMFVCASRPNLYERRAMWGDTLPFHSRLELNPLSGEASQQLVAEILQKAADIPGDLREMIVKNAEGNPFYMEELVKMLLDDGVIEKNDDEKWSIRAERMGGLRVPATLNGILQARFDNLPAEERKILQRASVVGRVFWDNALHFLSGPQAEATQPTPAVENALGMLRRREMIFPRNDSAFEGAREYIFKHALLRDAVYESILKRVRRNYHALVADWLINNSASGAGDLSGLIADHLEQAGQAVRAAEYLSLAGVRAAAQFANAEALGYFSRALALVPAEDIPARLKILLARESIYDLLGEREKQSKDLRALESYASQRGDLNLLADITLRRARYYQQTSDYPHAVVSAEAAIVLAQRSSQPQVEAAARSERGRALYRQAFYHEARAELEQALAMSAPDSGLQADVLQTLAIVTFYQGDMPASQDYLDRTRAILRRTGNRQVEANLLNSLGVAAMESNPDADAYFKEALAIYREIGDRRGEATALQQVGMFYDRRNDHETAQKLFSEALRLYQTVGDRLGEGWMHNAIGSLLQYQGRISEAWPRFETALGIYRAIHVPWGEAISLHNLGVAALACGQFDLARQHLQSALEICQQANDRWGEIWRLSYLGFLEFQLGKLDLALEYTTRALDYAYQVNASVEQGMALTHQAFVLAQMGKPELARRNLQQALVLRRDMGQRHLALETLAGLACIHQNGDERSFAMAYVDEILIAIKNPTSLNGTDDPFRVYLSAWNILSAANDPRALQVLKLARERLKKQLNYLDPERAASFRAMPNIQKLSHLLDEYLK